MEELKMRKFSLLALLFVTGLSFLLFTLYVKIAEGVIIELFLWTGIISLFAGLLAGMGILIKKKKG